MEGQGHHEYDVMCRFPLLGASEDLKKWTGFLSTSPGNTVLISLIVPEFPEVTHVHLNKDDLDEEALRFWSSRLKQISIPDCESFLRFLELLIEQDLKESSRTFDEDSTDESSEVRTNIISEFEAIGIENIVSLSADLNEIIIKHTDRSGREHQLKLLLQDYPQKKPIVTAELPFPTESIPWPLSVKEIDEMFLNLLEKSCSFWNDMEQLDNTVRVLDPIQPTKSHYHRKILLTDNVIIHLVFNASTPRALPQISFAGPEKHIDIYSAAMDGECSLWDDSLTVLQNLKSILNCDFVMKESSYGNYGDGDNNLDDQAPCLICYVYNFEDEIPEITCDCGAVYHRQCIHDLFVSDVSKTALRRCVECPSCQMEIRVPAGFIGGNW